MLQKNTSFVLLAGQSNGRFIDLHGHKAGFLIGSQIGKTNANGTPVSREVSAINDIVNAGESVPQFLDYQSPLSDGRSTRSRLAHATAEHFWRIFPGEIAPEEDIVP